MNRQGLIGTEKRGIEWANTWGVYQGYTSNPVSGCVHQCRWEMPTGEVAICYAEAIANRLATKAYPQWFSHLSFHPEEFEAIDNLKEPSGIFLGSMSDLVGAQVPAGWIQATIACIRRNPQHIFYVLTKNPPRLKQFEWPENAWVGVSAPPSFMFGKQWTIEQQTRWYDAALTTLGEIDVPIRWTSVEPLSWDVSGLLQKHWNHYEWAVIGAASNGAKTYQPDEAVFRKAWIAMGGHPVFLKGNIDRRLAVRVCGHWLEEWPLVLSDWRETRIV